MLLNRNLSNKIFVCIRYIVIVSKNNSGTNPKKGKSLAKPNPASVDLFSDEALAEAVTVPNSLSSETAEIEDVLDDDSV